MVWRSLQIDVHVHWNCTNNRQSHILGFASYNFDFIYRLVPGTTIPSLDLDMHATTKEMSAMANDSSAVAIVIMIVNILFGEHY